jgi:hypothetical protein
MDNYSDVIITTGFLKQTSKGLKIDLQDKARVSQAYKLDLYYLDGSKE